ncbi:MAG TPA: hypothetical protein VF397_06310 [Pyrinomonadaceae bacterium]
MKDAAKMTDKAILMHGLAVALAKAGAHQEAIVQFRTCLSIVEMLAAEAPNDTRRQQNLMRVLQALGDSLIAVDEKEEGAALQNRGLEILFRLDYAHRAATRFTFANREIDINVNDEKINSRQLLRNLESVVREKTGIGQIAIDFGGVDLPETTLSYDRETGYRLLLSPLEVLGGALQKTEAQMVEVISAHGAQHGVITAPPPIARTQTSIHAKLNFDTQANHYDSLAHDGGYVLAFYREKHSGDAVLLRHVPPLGFVHYSFFNKSDFEELQKDAAAHCSSFLDLSYLGEEDMSEDTLRIFLREHDLYGWGSKKF